MRRLVVYYSLSGNTAGVAATIAEKLYADLEQVRDFRLAGALGMLQALWQAGAHSTPRIDEPQKHAADYDLVILGCPVWAGRTAAPMRSYIKREREEIRRLGLFCTFAGHGGDATMTEMEAACGQTAVARLGVAAGALHADPGEALINQFIDKVRAEGTADLNALGGGP
jgi:flavodoxin